MRGPQATGSGASQLLIGVVVCLLLLLWSAPFALALEPPRLGELARLERRGRLDVAVARARAIGNHKVAPALLQGARERLQRAQLGLDAPLPAPPPA